VREPKCGKLVEDEVICDRFTRESKMSFSLESKTKRLKFLHTICERFSK